MKDNVLNAALREVVSREFADIPQHETRSHISSRMVLRAE